MTCYSAKSAPGTNTGTSYTYNNVVGTNNTVVDGDSPTVLSSFLGTGTNMSAVASSAQTSEVAVVPGLSGAGPGVPNAHTESSGTATATAAASTADSGTESTATGFSQFGTSSSSTNKNNANALTVEGKEKLGASLFAAVLAVAAMLVL